MSVKFYGYANCDSCRKAKKFLDARGVGYDERDITVTPPSKAELKRMLKAQGGQLKKLFNTSGQVYREKKISEKLPEMTESQVVDLLAKTGKLIKRPFVLDGDVGLVGFKEDQWKSQFK